MTQTNTSAPAPAPRLSSAVRRVPAAGAAPAAPAAPEAAPEQGQRKGLTARLREAGVAERARNFNPCGTYPGQISNATITKSGNGVQIRARHLGEGYGDTLGSLNFNLQRVKKLADGSPEIDQDTGAAKVELSLGAWKQWEAFCGRYGLDASETLDLIEQNRAAETGLIGVVETFKWTQSGDFFNISPPLDGAQAA